MTKGLARLTAFVAFVVLWMGAASAWGQDVTHVPEDEYKDLIRVSQDIQPLGDKPFGEDISLYDGTLSFEQTDISLAGNGPLLQLTRDYSLQGYDYARGRFEYAFGDWTLAIPRIETLTADGVSHATVNGMHVPENGWTVAASINDTSNFENRCSNFNPPPVRFTKPLSTTITWFPEDWWRGYHLVIPGQGSQDLLKNTGSDKITYTAITKNHWRIRCMPGQTQTANGEPGEGFIAEAPDGTQYTFNELVYRWAPEIDVSAEHQADQLNAAAAPAHASSSGSYGGVFPVGPGRGGGEQPQAPTGGPGSATTMGRQTGMMLVTQIKDRFGNTLTYDYNDNGTLKDIVASDGRELSLQYFDNTYLVQSATLQPSSGAPRTWIYGYTYTTNGELLSSVTLPDESQWHYDLGEFAGALVEPKFSAAAAKCNGLGNPLVDDSSWTGTITHPSGLVGTFKIQAIEHSRSYVQSWCLGEIPAYGADTPRSYLAVPDAWYGFTVVQKSFSGAGLPTETWNYAYSPPDPSLSDSPCASTNSCADNVYTDVSNPDGTSTRHTFSNRFDATESKQLSVVYYSGAAGASSVLRNEDYTYTTFDPGTCLDATGDALQSMINVAQMTQYMPLSQRALTQDGDTYTWQAEDFDCYQNVHKEKRSNTILGQVAEEIQTTYLNDTAAWVLGLPQVTTNLTTGDEVSKNDYSGDDTLHYRWAFGQKLMTYSFNSAGQLASITDNNGKTTTLSDYKRGIPQTIHYPATDDTPGYASGTSQSLVVDDFGQISSITDQVGHTTYYDYDAVGRLTQITYPSDSVSWYPKTFGYSYVTASERGIAGGHWDRTVSQGAARHVTYYDALLRPVLTDTYINGDGTSHISANVDYDWRGQKIFQSWPVAGSPSLGDSSLADGTTTAYDALGRVTSVSQPSELGTLTTTTTYLSGAREKVTDPKGNSTTTSYQVFDTPSYDNVIEVQAPEGITQTIVRDIYGSPTQITQGDVTKHFYYDNHHRLCRTQEPESLGTVLHYDDANNVDWTASGQNITGSDCSQDQVAPADMIIRRYDAMNRVESEGEATGINNTLFKYDALGNIARAESGISIWEYSRNALGLLTSETLTVDNGYQWSIGYNYDRYGSVSSITYPDGKVVDAAPDALGRPTQAGSYATGASYYPDGDLQHFTFMDGTEYLAEEDNPRNLLSNLSYSNGSNFIYSQDIEYDENANITHESDLTGSGGNGLRTKDMTYDALNRLTSADAPNLWGSVTYTYDTLNNIRTRFAGSNQLTYNYDGYNRLTSISLGSGGFATYHYDDRGNLAQSTVVFTQHSYVFDTRNQLTNIPGVADYYYDASGRRVKTHSLTGGGDTYYAYNSAGQLMWQYASTSGTGSDYIYLGKRLIAKVEPRTSSGSAPSAPASVTVPSTNSTGTFTVTWSTSSGATSYKLQQQQDSGAWTDVNANASTTSQGVTVTDNGSYHYRVQACNSNGCSGYTTSTAVVVTLSNPPPAAPTTITVPSTNTTGTFTVTWSTSSGATSYKLQQQQGSGSWTDVTTTTDPTVSAGVTVASSGSYTYRVQACVDTTSCSGYTASNPVDVTLPDPAPAAPATITVPSSNTTDNFTVSWSASSGATAYKLQDQLDGGVWTDVTTTAAPTTSASVTVMNSGTFVFRVQACNGANSSVCSAYTTSSEVSVSLTGPSQVTGVTVPDTSTTGVFTLTWDPTPGATKYFISGNVNGGSWQSLASVTGNGNTSYQVTETVSGTYQFSVLACNDITLCSSYATPSNPILVDIPNSVPVQPGSITVPQSSTTGSYTVSWSSAVGATGYIVQHQIGSGNWSTIYDGTGNTALSTAVQEGASGSYYYRVQACNTNGCSTYKTSNLVNVTMAPSGAPSLTVPASSDTGSFVVSWSGVADANSYTLQEQVGGGSWTEVYSDGATTASIYGKAPGDYSYRVQACNSIGCGPWSAIQSITVNSSIPAPTGVRAVKGNNSLYMASWHSVAGATRYHAIRNDTGAQVYNGSGTSFLMGFGSSSAPPYNFSVQACDATSCSAWASSN